MNTFLPLFPPTKRILLSAIFCLLTLSQIVGQVCNALAEQNSIDLESQEDVDNFIATYGTCDSINVILNLGGSEIDGTIITNLDSLAHLKKVKWLVILNTELTDLDDIENIDFWGTENLFIRNNYDLVDISALRGFGPSAENVVLQNNSNLENLDGLDSLKSIETGLTITDHENLTDIRALSGITSISMTFRLYNNPVLSDISPLSNWNYFGNDANVENRAQFELFNNESLANCSPFCNLIQNQLLALLDDEKLNLNVYDNLGQCFDEESFLQFIENANTGIVDFEHVQADIFRGVDRSDIAHGDIDGDGDVDVIVVGEDYYNNSRTDIYINVGAGSYMRVDEDDLPSLEDVSISLADINGDGDLDFLITGMEFFIYEEGPSIKGSELSKNLEGLVPTLYLFENDGNGDFSAIDDFDEDFNLRSDSQSEFVDYDNDGDPDIIYMGSYYGEGIVYDINFYKNDGFGEFGEDYNANDNDNIQGLIDGDIEFGDFDNDALLDFVVTGENENSGKETIIYGRNNDGSYTILSMDEECVECDKCEGCPGCQEYCPGEGFPEISFEGEDIVPGITYGSISLGDVNGDTFLDIFITGTSESYNPFSSLYLGDGDGGFNEGEGQNFVSLENSNSELSDFDNDGDLDLILIGLDIDESSQSRFYSNDGAGNFTADHSTPLENFHRGAIGVFDADGNGYKDVLITGDSESEMFDFYEPNSEKDISEVKSLDEEVLPPPYTFLYFNSGPRVDIIRSCDPITWIDGIEYTSSNNTAIYTFTNAAGCDSTIRLDFTLVGDELAGGIYNGHSGVDFPQTVAAGVPDGVFTGGIDEDGFLILDYPFLSAGTNICVTVKFANEGGISFTLNNEEVEYFSLDEGLKKVVEVAEMYCITVETEGVQQLIIRGSESDTVFVDGSTYEICPPEDVIVPTYPILEEKPDTVIESALTYLTTIDPDDEDLESGNIYTFKKDSVLIEVIMLEGKTTQATQALIDLGLRDTIDNGMNELILSGYIPIDSLSAVNRFKDCINFARPLYRPILDAGITTS